MAASIAMRPSQLKTLCYLRGYCLGCQRGQSTLSSQVTNNKSDDLPVGRDGKQIPKGQIKIPNRKRRDSLDILKALSSTVEKNSAGPYYQYMDDPNLIPRTLRQKKFALLSKASGRRTARFMINEYKEAFNHDDMAPYVEAFQPKNLDYTYHELCTEALLERIDQQEVKDAIEVYERMQEDGVEVTDEAKLRFLELLCVFGNKNSSQKLMPEERLLEQELISEDQNESLEFSLSLAEDIFASLPQKTDEAYNWITRALLKDGYDRGFALYKEMKTSKIPVYLSTYNALIKYSYYEQSFDWGTVKDYLMKIKTAKLAPNLETFHSILHAISQTKQDPFKLVSKLPQILAEMAAVEIEPTLTTWSLVLDVLENKRHRSVMTDFVTIIDCIKKQHDEGKLLMDSSTERFFFTAMKRSRSERDSQVAIQLFELKESLGANYVMTDIVKDKMFYEDLLSVVSMVESADLTMDIYNKVVPFQAQPMKHGLFSILNCISAYEAYQYLDRIWIDMNIRVDDRFITFDLLEKFLEVISTERMPQQYKQSFGKIAKQLLTDRLEAMEMSSQFHDPTFFQYLIKIFLNNNDLDSAMYALMEFYNKKITDFLAPEVISAVFEAAVLKKDAGKIKNFINLPENVLKESYLLDNMANIIMESRDVLEEILTGKELETLEQTFTLQ